VGCFNRSWCPRRLRRGSAAGGLLGLRVRFLRKVWIFFSGATCCHVEVSATGRSLFQRISTKVEREKLCVRVYVCVYVCVCVCVSLSVVMCNIKYLHLQRIC